jgi:hypothetical protein
MRKSNAIDAMTALAVMVGIPGQKCEEIVLA